MGEAMHALSLLLLIPFAQVKVAVGPEVAITATPVVAAIDHVTVYSDRARIRRVGQITVPSGATAVRLPDLPGGVLLHTVRLRCDGAEVARVETSPIQLERITIDQVDDLLVKLEALVDRISLIDARIGVLDQSMALVRSLRPKPAVAETERVGKTKPAMAPSIWRRVLDFVDAKQRDLAAQRETLLRTRREAAKAHVKLQQEVARYDLGGLSDKKTRVVAILDAGAKRKVTLHLEYFVPGAYWRPSYDLHFDPNESRITLNAAGLVTQATGEAWENARLSLSTAIPGQGITPPELLTWTLGVKREYVPRAREKSSRVAARRFPPPRPQLVPAEKEAAARRQVLAQRVALLRSLARQAVGSPARAAGRVSPAERRVMKKKAKRARRRPSAPPRARAERSMPSAPVAASMPEPAMMDFEEDMDDMPSAVMSGDRQRGASGRRKQRSGSRVSLSLFAADSARRPTFSDPTLPAMLAGGLDYVFEVPQRTTVPSDGQSLRAPFASRRYAVQTFYEATPSIETVAYLKAVVKNGGDLPILGGPANIFVSGRFTSQTRLETTGPGGELALPLGADEDIRLVRTIVPNTKTEGVFSKEDVTRYTVTIEVGNYKRRSIQIQITDQLPKTNQEKITIERGGLAKPLIGPDGEGILRWDREIAAGKTEKLVFSYSIRRPADWRLTQ
jgi:hypothetical protein